MVMIVVFIWVEVIRLCRLGKVVLSDDAFQVTMFVSWLVFMFVIGVWVGIFKSGGG